MTAPNDHTTENDQFDDFEYENEDDQPQKRGVLSKIFNANNLMKIAAGAAVTTAIRSGFIATMTWAAAPAIATLVTSAVAVGVASTLFSHYTTKKENRGALFGKANLKKAAFSATFGLIGGGLVLGFSEGVFQNAWNGLFGASTAAADVAAPVADTVVDTAVGTGADTVIVAPAAEDVVGDAPAQPEKPVLQKPDIPDAVEKTPEPVVEKPAVAAPAAASVPASAPAQLPDFVQTHPFEFWKEPGQFSPFIEQADCPAATDALTDQLKDVKVSRAVRAALSRLESGDAQVVAQATKDLAYFTYNGFGGIAKDTSLALELYAEAAQNNVQARIDLAYLQYHGLSDVAQNKQAAIEAVAAIKETRAQTLGAQWAGKAFGNVTPNADFDAESIVKGAVKPRCPTL